MFYDLSFPCDDVDPTVQKERLSMAAKLGYDCVALNHVVQGKVKQFDVIPPTHRRSFVRCEFRESCCYIRALERDVLRLAALGTAYKLRSYAPLAFRKLNSPRASLLSVS